MHLGHTLQQDLTMGADARERRAKFIARTVEVRGQFAFAAPPQILKAVKIMACDAYGSVLWRLDSPSASAFFSAYTSCLRRIWRLPLNTFTFLVQGHLAGNTPSLKHLVLSRVPKFYQQLLKSPSAETRLVAEVAAADARTVLAGNLAYVGNLSKLDMSLSSAREVREALPGVEVPEKEAWRLLDILLRQRSELEKEGAETKAVIAMISSLCTT